MEKKCEKCGVNIDHKNKGAKFCSSSCRVAYFQKEKRASEPTMVRVKRKMKQNTPKGAIQVALGIMFLGMAYLVVGKGVEAWSSLEVNRKNDELIQLKADYEALQESYNLKADMIEDWGLLEKKYDVSMKLLSALLTEKNGWLKSESYYEKFHDAIPKEDLKILKADIVRLTDSPEYKFLGIFE